MKKLWTYMVAVGMLLLACGVNPGSTPSGGNPNMDTLPSGKEIGTVENHESDLNAQISGASKGGNGIYYHGGPVMLGTINTYFIWYGNWSQSPVPNILADFMNHLGGSPYYNTNTTYHNGSNVHLSNSLHYSGSTIDNYSQGAVLRDDLIKEIVAGAIQSGRLPLDPNGVYFVMTSADVDEIGFCSQFCAWHDHGMINNADIKYSFIGDPTRCPASCEIQKMGPNGNSGADGMASIIAHELIESASDPDLNAWFDAMGYENADKCAWTYGPTYLTQNGTRANMKLGARDYLIQQNWVNALGGYCAQTYP